MYNLNWVKGRQLEKYGKHHFEYNANGIRTSRYFNATVDGQTQVVRYNYELEGSKVTRIVKLRDSAVEYELIPLYDTNDSPIGLIYENTPYWFIKNLQGDIVAIRDEDNYDVVRYNYDAWGNVTVLRDHSECSLSINNPFLYRGYIYDREFSLYYLQSRYYDPEIGRFINPDEPIMLDVSNINLKCNLYTYCENDPLNKLDPTGRSISLLTCVIIGAVVGAISGAVISKMVYGEINGWWVLGGAIAGGVLGYFGGAFFGASGIKGGTLAAKISMKKVRWLGKLGEKLSKLPKNTKHIDSFTRTAKYRIPDYLDEVEKIIGDVKNVKKLSYTNQLKDFMLYAEKHGYTYVIKIRQSTQLSGTLKRLVDAGKIVLWYL